MTMTAVQNPLEGRDVVCMGFNDWDGEEWTNQQHLMSRLAAKGSGVLFIESLGLRRPSLGSGRDLRRMGRRLRRGLGSPRQRDGVTVLSPLVLPLHSHATVRSLNAWILRHRVGRIAQKLHFDRPILWAYVPQADALVDALDPELVIYHCVDDIAAHDGVDAPSFTAAERSFAPRADLIIASAPALAERMAALSDDVLYAPNVADTALFATALEPGAIDPQLATLSEPRIVFVGAVASNKVDFELVMELASARRHWTFALIGPIGLGYPQTDVSALMAQPNVHLLGPRAHADLPSVLRGAAVGVIPYRQSRLTASIFPMKVYEYLAAGLPVVATGVPALKQVQEVLLFKGVDETVAALERVLAEDSANKRRARSITAQAHSWDIRLAEIGAAVRPRLREKAVSVGAALGPQRGAD